MKKNVLGKTGVEVTEMGFGAWAIGGSGRGLNYGQVSEKESLNCLETYLEAGGNHIDTARGYNNSERSIGLILKDPRKREQVFLASKTGQNNPEGIQEELEKSLRLLQTEYLDLYYMHAPPDDVDGMNRNFDVFEQLRDEGKIHFIGASIKGPNVTQDTIDLCRQYINTGRIDAIELIYSILRQKNSEIFHEAKAKGVGLVGRTSLESGFLTGEYKPGHKFAETDHRSRWPEERLRKILECIQDLERTVVKPPYEALSQIAIRFAMTPDAIASTIVGAESAEHVRQNLRVLEMPPLDEDLMARLVREYGDRGAALAGGWRAAVAPHRRSRCPPPLGGWGGGW